jgi:hypothetical protein
VLWCEALDFASVVLFLCIGFLTVSILCVDW